MTKEEAIKTLREDYCGNRIICELYPDQCNREDCEIWLAIKALETQSDGDCISRRAFRSRIETEYRRWGDEYDTYQVLSDLDDFPSAQPEITPDGTLNISINADVASVGRILLSQAGTQRGGLYYKDAQPEIIRCLDCKYYDEVNQPYPQMYCRKHSIDTSDQDFCSRAERKDDE